MRTVVRGRSDRERVLGDDHPHTLGAMAGLGRLYVTTGRFDAAEPLLKELCAGIAQALPEGDWRIGTSLDTYGQCLSGLQRYDQAEEKLLEAHRIFVSARGADDERTISTVRAIIKLYEAWAAAEPGKGYAEKAAEWRAQSPPADSDAARDEAAHEPDSP